MGPTHVVLKSLGITNRHKLDFCKSNLWRSVIPSDFNTTWVGPMFQNTFALVFLLAFLSIYQSLSVSLYLLDLVLVQNKNVARFSDRK